jgi:multidrug efflux pump subunit AcrA (membrane-fusion protein)
LKLEEVDRGKTELGQTVKVRIDAIQDREFDAAIDFISPIASLNFRGGPGASNEKSFPARATLKGTDPRLRPGMSATGVILIESQPDVLLIPNKASFLQGGKPHVWVQRGQNFVARPIEVGKRNDNDIIVTKGLQEGERIAMENPAEAAKRSKKL